MAFICELDRGCFGCSLRSTVHAGILHYIIHGFFITSFVFSNYCYPPYGFPDYFLGLSGGALIFVAFFSTFVTNLEKLQWLRFTFGILLAVIVFLTVIATFVYTFERWNDVMTTLLTHSLRKPLERDFPDYFWFTLVILACLCCSLLLFYLIYIMSYLCNENKPPFISETYHQPGVVLRPTPSPAITVPSDSYSSKTYKPYPSQYSKGH